MTEQLKKIQMCFNKASKSYNKVAFVQKEAAKFLVKQLLNHQYFIPETILDLGSGTGCIPELLLEKFPNASFYLNYIAAEMLKICQDKFSQYTNFYYIPGDMLRLGTELYDCVTSNLALQ